MTDITTAPRWLRGPLRPFRSGQYRLLAASVVMSLFAAGVWLIALVWQVIAMGGGPTDLSFVAAATAVGMLATTLLGGVFADRIPQRRILLTVATARTIAIGVVALLALGDLLALWHLVVVAFVLGAGNGFTFPAYSALLPSILPAEDLMAANGVEGMLRPTVMQAAGPAVASALIAASSPGRRDRRGGAGRAGRHRRSSSACGRCRCAAIPPRSPPTRCAACWSTCATASSTWCARRGCSRPCCSRRC